MPKGARGPGEIRPGRAASVLVPGGVIQEAALSGSDSRLVPPVRTATRFRIDLGKWWATLESNQAWVSPAELQSAAAPCSTSPEASWLHLLKKPPVGGSLITAVLPLPEEVVGDPGIEPGMGLPGGVTVRCRTLQHVARRCVRGYLPGHHGGVKGSVGRKMQIPGNSGKKFAATGLGGVREVRRGRGDALASCAGQRNTARGRLLWPRTICLRNGGLRRPCAERFGSASCRQETDNEKTVLGD